MDITYIKNNYSFQCRVSACIFNKEMTKLLVFQAHGKNVHLLVGGKMHEKEKSFDALKREFKEEINADIIVKDFLGISENIFTYQGKKAHELILFYSIEIPDNDYMEEYHIADEDGCIAKWINIDEFKNRNKIIYPEEIYKYI